MGVIDMAHIAIYQQLSSNNYTACFHCESEKAYRRNSARALASIEGHMLWRSISLFLVMPHFPSSIAIESKEVRDDPYDMVKNLDQCFAIFHRGIDSVFLDNTLSTHRIKRFKSKTKNQYTSHREKNSKQWHPYYKVKHLYCIDCYSYVVGLKVWQGYTRCPICGTAYLEL